MIKKLPSGLSAEETFSRIIKQRFWRDHPCGSGSLLQNTQNLRDELPIVVQQLACQSLLDAPCGDYSWMSTVTWPEGFQYIGADIVSDMIDQLKSRWPDRDFRHLNIIHDPLPKVDIMLCRDCLIHFPWQAIRETIENFVRSGIQYLATTSYTVGQQEDIEMGGCHHINLCARPACFPPPLHAILDQGNPGREHHVMIWDREQLITVLENWK